MLSAVIPIIHGGLQLTTCSEQEKTRVPIDDLFLNFSFLFHLLYFIFYSFICMYFFQESPDGQWQQQQLWCRALIFDVLLDTFWIPPPLACPNLLDLRDCAWHVSLPGRQRFQLNFHNFPPPTQEQRLMR